MKKPARINKKNFKKSEGKCRICGEKRYELLDCHRILSGQNNGEYKNGNVAVICSNCHRLVHAGVIVIDRYYLCTDATYKLRIISGGEEKFI